MISEGPIIESPDMKHAKKLVGGEQWDTEHHLDALFPEDRIRHGRGVDAIEPNRTSTCRDPAREASPYRDTKPLAHLLLKTASCGCDEFSITLRDQQDCCGVRVE